MGKAGKMGKRAASAKRNPCCDSNPFEAVTHFKDRMKCKANYDIEKRHALQGKPWYRLTLICFAKDAKLNARPSDATLGVI